MDKKRMKDAVCKDKDQHRDEIIHIGETIRVAPELG